jgi:formate-dependent nitrite reductase membrane component NrfD
MDSIPAVPTAPPAQQGNIALPLLFVLFAAGVASLYFSTGNESAGSDIPLLTATFLYLMGVSQVGVVFCAITRLVKAQWSKPYYRLAELSTLAFFPFAIIGLLLIYFYARDDLFYWLSAGPDAHLSPWLNSDWLLARNLFGLLLFYGLSLFYAMQGIRADRAAERGATEDQLREIENRLYLFSPVVVLGFVLCNTFLAWDFAMMLIPHWHSTVFPIYYWFGNLFAGSAAMIVFPAVLGRSEMGARYFGPDQIRSLGMMVTAFTLLWLYFFWAQFFVIWFGNLPHESEPLWRQMYGHYSPYYWTMMAGCFFVPLAALLFAAVKRSLLAMCLLAAGINLGIWISRYLMVVPVFSPDNRPFTHWPDISIAVGLVAGFLAVLILLCRRFPTYAQWEMSVKPIRRFPTA